MVLSFQNKFFSFSGFKERLANVGAVYAAALNPFDDKTVKSNTGVKVVDKVLGAAASNPYATALVGTVAAAPRAAAVLGRTAVKKAATSFAGASLKTKAAIVGGSIVGGRALAESPKLRKKAFVTVTELPSSLSNVGKNIGRVVEDPSLKNVKALVTENPGITAGALLLGAGGVVSKVGTGVIAGTIARRTTSSVNLPQNVPSSPSTGVALPATTTSLKAAPVVQTAPTSPITPQTKAVSTTTRKRRRVIKAKPAAARQSQNVKVQIINQSGNAIGRTN